MSHELAATQFEDRLAEGLKTVARVLEATRNPKPAGTVSHSYGDKYLLAEFVTIAASSATVSALEHIGLSEEVLLKIQQQQNNRTVTLRFECNSNSDSLRTTKREIKGPEHKTSVTGAVTAAFSSQAKTTVTEYHWSHEINYVFKVYFGTDTGNAITLTKNNVKTEIISSTDTRPFPAQHTNVDICNLNWLLNSTKGFTIDRRRAHCHTPYRNPDVEAALSFFASLREGLNTTIETIRLWKRQEPNNKDFDDKLMTSQGVFVPVIPLLEDTGSSLPQIEDESTATTTVSLPKGDLQQFLSEHVRSLKEKFSDIEKSFPSEGLITVTVAQMHCLLLHIRELCRAHSESMKYIEDMLYVQLARAVGKVVTAIDFREYMNYHTRKLMVSEFHPRPFSFAIRKPKCSPEGFFGIEQVGQKSGDIDEPVQTSVCTSTRVHPMRFALNASSDVLFTGTQHVHSLVNYRFSSDVARYNMVASARQFCGFIMMIGRIGGANLFLPSHSLIIKNKTDIQIPLLMEEVPSAKQFKKAIDSMSPEQQRFAKAYRSMQLESTLFGCCVINIRTQLEKVLNLPEDSLLKEIALAEDVANLFIEYQISADLLAYNPLDASDAVVTAEQKIKEVKQHVEMVKKVLDDEKQEEIRNSKMAAEVVTGRKVLKTWCAAPRDFGVEDDEIECRLQRLSSGCARGVDPEPCEPEGDFSEGDNDDPWEIVGDDDEGAQQPKPTQADISQLPAVIESKLSQLDTDGSLRPTVIKTGERWTKKHHPGLLSPQQTMILSTDEQKSEHKKTLDLLDALTRSGALSLTGVDLHVVIASTHGFERSLLDTVIQQNVNPIEKVERSLLITSGVTHNKPVCDIISSEHFERVKEHSPQIM